jgi:hypothetical protein
VALINDYQFEEIPAELFVDVPFFFTSRDALIKA